MPPEWLEKRDIIHFHRMLIEEHGGIHGISDEGALESTLSRPLQLLNYQANATIFELAASYGFGFAKNHVFLDGNKRISLASIDVFLQINAYQLTASEEEAVFTILDLASGAIGETDLANWIENRSSCFGSDGLA